MKCKKCGKKIDELEKYCDDCKTLLKNEKELDKLIEKNKELNKLEITKELNTLHNFKDIKKENTAYLKEELKGIVNIEDEEIKVDNKKDLIIILSIIFISIIIIVVTCLFVFKKDKKEEVIESINYEKVLKEYGDNLTKNIKEYLDENEEIPSWATINDLFVYDKHDVVCKIHNIYKDGSIYLNDCKIDKKSIEYSYGKEKKAEGKKINIYKETSENDYYEYTEKETGESVGVITCNSEECEFVTAYDKYVLIEEEGKYYLYNYEDDSLEFGPFDLIDNDYKNNLLKYGNKLYGILYNLDNQTNIYNAEKEVILKNIEGNLLESAVKYNPEVMYKYGYVVFNNNNNEYNFVNLNTGNISYTITGTLNSFIEDTTKKIVYITTYNQSNKKITIYNSNGKNLFEGKEFNDMRLVNGDMIVSNDTNFYVYDSNLKLKTSSKTYTNILGVYDDFVIINNGNLCIVDLSDNTLATFDLKWNSSYKIDILLSGKKDNIIYVILEDGKDTLKYYYNLTTNEVGKS